MRLNLLNNAFNFLSDAVEQLSKNPGDQEIKFSLVHLCIAVELILKQKLFEEDPKLIFANEKNADEKLLNPEKIRTVSLSNAVTRVKKECGVNLTDEQERILEKLSRGRNKVVHYDLTISREEMTVTLLKTWGLILDFIHSNLDLKKYDGAESMVRWIGNEMIRHKDFLELRMKDIKPKLDKYRSESIEIIDCFKCDVPAFPFTGLEESCLMCGETISKEIIVQSLYSERIYSQAMVSTGDELLDVRIDESRLPPSQECPECKEMGLYKSPKGFDDPPKIEWFCVKCFKIELCLYIRFAVGYPFGLIRSLGSND